MHSPATSTVSSSSSYESADTELYGELVDFKGIGLVDEAFIPWLEEVCEWHPSLLESQSQRTNAFAGWAFTALGRVLNFLATTKGVDMTESACECLHKFWEEVQIFGFDLAWLEPQVTFAFNMSDYVERLGWVGKLEEKVRMLKLELKELSMGLIDVEKTLSFEKGDMENGLEELVKQVDTESVLGYRRRVTTVTSTSV